MQMIYTYSVTWIVYIFSTLFSFSVIQSLLPLWIKYGWMTLKDKKYIQFMHVNQAYLQNYLGKKKLVSKCKNNINIILFYKYVG